MTALSPEQQYYEAASFWDGDQLSNESGERIRLTAALVPSGARSLLDVGCGNGLFVNHLQQAQPGLERIVGFDRSSAALAHVRTERRQGSADAIPFDAQSFDVVSCLEVIEHLPLGTYERTLSELVRTAREHVIISVPYRESLAENVTQCPACLTIFNLDLHLRSFDEHAMMGLLSTHGFRCVRLETMGEASHYLGQRLYTRLLKPGLVRAWRSPVCPLCAYTRPLVSNAQRPIAKAPEASLVRAALSRAKRLWPRVRRPYWIAAVYQRIV